MLSVILSALMLSSCASGGILDDKNTHEISEGQMDDLGIKNILAVSAAKPSGIAVDDGFIADIADFSEKLFKAVCNPEAEENTVLSPLSVIYALSLCANGASGETLSEFENVLGCESVSKMNEYLYTLTESLGMTEKSTFDSANAVWANADSFTLNDSFADVAKRYYKVEAASLSFSDQKTLKIINDWVSKNTDGMIKDALDELDPCVAVMLMNTVLFDGVWENEYSENDINKGIFTNRDDTKTECEYMYSKEYSYFETDGGVGFSKAYKDGYSFIAVLPDEGTDIRDFVSEIDLSDIIEKASEGGEEVQVQIPKFEYDFKTDLRSVLTSLGLEKAFTSDAELGGLQAGGENNLYISDILQKAKIITNEHGTKAVAVTEIMVRMTSMIHDEPKRIYLDRPFFYAITNSDGVVLFVGTVETLN